MTGAAAVLVIGLGLMAIEALIAWTYARWNGPSR